MTSSQSTSQKRSITYDLSLLHDEEEEEEEVSGRRRRRTVIWSTTSGGCPTIDQLSHLLPSTLSSLALSDLTVQIIRHVPLNSLPVLLNHLICCYWRSPPPPTSTTTTTSSSCTTTTAKLDFHQVQLLAARGKKSVCGHVFKKGELVWTCRQCAKDPTCVQCDPCFRRSNHQGHEVYFHRASGNGTGCCDCGDNEAWSSHGHCLDHNHTNTTSNTTSNTTTSTASSSSSSSSSSSEELHNPAKELPNDLQRGLRAVLKGINSFFVSYLTAYVRSFESFDHNEYIQKMRLYSPMEKIVASLHNDDVHTFQDVIQALHALGHSVHDARVLTEQVDQVGHALVYSGVLASYQQLEQCYDKLVVRSGLIFSMMPKEVYQMLPVIPALIRWCLALGEMQEGLRRVIVEELLIDFREQEEEEVEQQEEEGKGKGNAGRKKKRSPYSLSALDSEKWSFYQRFECCKVLEEEEQFPFEVSQLSSFETLSLDHLHGNLSLSPAQALAAALGGAGGGGGEVAAAGSGGGAGGGGGGSLDYDFKHRVRYPFQRCPPSTLALLLLSSAFAPPPIVHALSDLVIRFQYDALFKAAYAQLFTLLYPSLVLLYHRHYGTADHSLLHSSVQFYTAQSIAETMSSMGILPPPPAPLDGSSGSGSGSRRRRVLGEEGQDEKRLTLSNMLVNTLHAILLDCGCPKHHDVIELPPRRGGAAGGGGGGGGWRSTDEDFLGQHAIRTKRYSFITRDLEFLTCDRVFCLYLLLGRVDPGLVS
eukprot:scaffold1001_cov188-Ochromonas_danica.AAC.10